MLYVTDDGNFSGFAPGPSAAILKVQFSPTANPLVTVLSFGGNLFAPVGITYINGSLYVTDSGNSVALLSQGYVLKIDPTSGQQTLFTETVGKFKCPVGIQPAYNNGVVDTTKLWVADQGSNASNEPNTTPVGTIWKVDLRRVNAPIAISQGGDLTIHTVYINPPTNFTLGNLQNLTVNPLTGKLYVPQFGFQNAAGSVVSVDPSTPAPTLIENQTPIAEDDAPNHDTDHPPTPSDTVKLGWYVTGDGWDANFNGLGARVLVGALDKPDSLNTQRGHISVVDPAVTGNNDNDTNVQKLSENGTTDNAYIATPGGIITYTSTPPGGAALPSTGHSPTSLGSIAVSTPDTMALSSRASAPSEAGSASTNLGTATLELPSAISNLADVSVPATQVDRFWEKHAVTGARHDSGQAERGR